MPWTKTVCFISMRMLLKSLGGGGANNRQLTDVRNAYHTDFESILFLMDYLHLEWPMQR